MTEPTTITITRQVPAEADRAFAAWTDPVKLAQWWWPQMPDVTYEIDAREGGSYAIDAPGAGIGVTGTFTAVDPPRALSMTWIWMDDGTPAEVDGRPVIDTVDVTFTPTGEGTEVTVRHTSTEHAADGGAEQGWNDVMDRLPGHLAS